MKSRKDTARFHKQFTSFDDRAAAGLTGPAWLLRASVLPPVRWVPPGVEIGETRKDTVGPPPLTPTSSGRVVVWLTFLGWPLMSPTSSGAPVLLTPPASPEETRARDHQTAGQ